MTQYEVKDGVGIIPEGETVIDHSAFEDCKSLTSVIIPDSVTEIRSYAFRDCTGLKSIVIPKSVTEIWDKVFAGCTSLTSIVVSKGNKVYDSRNKSNAIIETATNKLIAGCSNTVIPDSVTEIGTDAFACCTSLKNIVIPSSVTKIGEDAFYLCTDLSSIVIPNSVKEIVMGAFSGCTGLTSIVIPDAVSIPDKAFDCCNLKSITVVDENGEAINNNNAIVSPRYRFIMTKAIIYSFPILWLLVVQIPLFRKMSSRLEMKYSPGVKIWRVLLSRSMLSGLAPVLSIIVKI